MRVKELIRILQGKEHTGGGDLQEYMPKAKVRIAIDRSGTYYVILSVYPSDSGEYVILDVEPEDS